MSTTDQRSQYPTAEAALAALARAYQQFGARSWLCVRITPAAACGDGFGCAVTGFVFQGEWGEFYVTPNPGNGVPMMPVPGWIARIDHATADGRATPWPLYVASDAPETEVTA